MTDKLATLLRRLAEVGYDATSVVIEEFRRILLGEK